LQHLASADPIVADIEAVRACFLTGMMLLRQTTEDDTDRMTLWRPLPYLLAATLAEDRYHFRLAHLAWAMDAVNLSNAARHFSELALARSGAGGEWLTETAIVMRFNWTGLVDETTERLMSTTASSSSVWCDSLRAYGHLLNDDREHLCPLIDRITLGALWARRVHAYATARCRTFVESVPLFVSLLEDAMSMGDSPTAVEAALVLGNIDTARAQVKDYERSGVLSPYMFSFWQVLIDIMRGQQGATDQAEHLVDRGIRPFDLRSFAHAQLPTLIEASSDRPDVVRALLGLQHACAAAADGLAEDPALTVELDAGHAQCSNPELEAGVRALLETAQSARAGDLKAAAVTLRGLDYRPDQGIACFEHALGMAINRLEGTTDAEVADAPGT
jgi:hypothetical protein